MYILQQTRNDGIIQYITEYKNFEQKDLFTVNNWRSLDMSSAKRFDTENEAYQYLKNNIGFNPEKFDVIKIK